MRRAKKDAGPVSRPRRHSLLQSAHANLEFVPSNINQITKFFFFAYIVASKCQKSWQNQQNLIKILYFCWYGDTLDVRLVTGDPSYIKEDIPNRPSPQHPSYEAHTVYSNTGQTSLCICWLMSMYSPYYSLLLFHCTNRSYILRLIITFPKVFQSCFLHISEVEI